MEGQDPAIMRKETILKEDGRYLIYYHFESSQEGQVAEGEKAERK